MLETVRRGRFGGPVIENKQKPNDPVKEDPYGHEALPQLRGEIFRYL